MTVGTCDGIGRLQAHPGTREEGVHERVRVALRPISAGGRYLRWLGDRDGVVGSEGGGLTEDLSMGTLMVSVNLVHAHAHARSYVHGTEQRIDQIQWTRTQIDR